MEYYNDQANYSTEDVKSTENVENNTIICKTVKPDDKNTISSMAYEFGEEKKGSLNYDIKGSFIQNEDALDIDDLLLTLGEFGKYQKQLLWFVCLPACLPCGFCAFNQLFMANTPAHWCNIPELQNLTTLMRKNIAIPTIKDQNSTYSRCMRYDINWAEATHSQRLGENLIANQTMEVIPCDKGWEYNQSEVFSSIVIEFDLVCSHEIYPTLGLAALNAGGPIGVYMFGNLNDRFGRRLSFFTCLGTLIAGASLTSISSNFWSWTLTRILVGLTIPAIYQIPFIISLELVGPNYRSFITVMTCTFYTIGLCMLAGVTFIIQKWRAMAIITSLPFSTYFVYWWFLPESPRWLLSKGRFLEANDILLHLSQVNGTKLPVLFTQQLQNQMRIEKNIYSERKTPDVFLLFKTPNMRLKTCLITLNWFANNLVYVGLSYYGPALGNEEHLSFFFSSLAEIPSYLACWFVMDRWGRRWPLCFCMVVAGISCIATVSLPPDSVGITLALFLISKSAISASFLIIYPFAGELYPTQLRGVAIGFSAYISGLGLIIIPFITYLGKDNLVLPLVIMGFISIVGGITALRLPETLHERLPETIEEGENFGKNWKWWNICKSSSIEYTGNDIIDNKQMFSESSNDSYTENNLFERDPNRLNLRQLIKQTSILDTQKNSDGSIQMTYWF